MIDLDNVVRLPLPVLDGLEPGQYSLGVPSVGDNLQVGFRGLPEAFPRIGVLVAANLIEISREDRKLLQFEAPIVAESPQGKRHTVRRPVLTSAVDKLVLNRLEPEGNDASAGGLWVVDASVVKPENRVGVSRTAAKIGDAIIAKEKKAARQASVVA